MTLHLYQMAPQLLLWQARYCQEIFGQPNLSGWLSFGDRYVMFPAREERTGFVASSAAMEKALELASAKVGDVQIAELYDQSTMLELVSLEDLGFTKKGNI
jgi:acetyl-CoA acetyltransferase